MYLILWEDVNGRQHHKFFAECDDVEHRVETEALELLQTSVTSKKKEDQIVRLSIVRGKSIKFEKKEKMVVTNFKLVGPYEQC